MPGARFRFDGGSGGSALGLNGASASDNKTSAKQNESTVTLPIEVRTGSGQCTAQT